MKTLYKEAENKAYSINETFSRRIGSKHVLLTTRHGSWVLLTEEEFERFENREFDFNSEFFERLKDLGIIITQDSADEIKKDLRKKHSRLFRPPTYHVIPVSESCNLNCEYCHPDAQPGKGIMDRDVAEDIIEYIFSIPNLEGSSMRFVLTGGEPLLNYDVVRFLADKIKKESEGREIRTRVSMVTNMTKMNDDIAEELSDSSISVSTSLDGPKELHNKHRHYNSGKGTFETVTHWMKRLKNKYNMRISAMPVVTNISLEYGPESLVDIYRDLGQGTVFFKPYRPQGRGEKRSDLRMEPEDFFEYYKEGLEYILELWKKGEKIVERKTREFMENFLSPSRRSMCMDRPCGAGLTMLSWNKDREVYACDSLRSEEEAKLGNIDEDSYMDLRGNALPFVSMTTDVIPECTKCPYQSFCGTCPGNGFGERGDPLPKPPLSFECKWQKKAFDYLMKKIAEGQDSNILKNWSREYQRKIRKSHFGCHRF